MNNNSAILGDGKFDEIISEITNWLPENLGTFRITKPTGTPTGLVVCISDLFCHIPVQRNIADIIGQLGYRHRFQLVCVEGASGKGDTSVLWSLPRHLRLSFCESLFEKGYLTGAEFAVVSRPQLGMSLYGVDVPSLYRKQWRACKENFASRSTIIVPLLDSRRRMRRLYEPFVSRNLLRLIRLRYPGDGEWELGQHFNQCIDFLLDFADKKDVTMPADLWAAISKSRKSASDGLRARGALVVEMRGWVAEHFLPVSQLLDHLGSETKNRFETAHWLETVYDQLQPMFKQLAHGRYSVDSVLRQVPQASRTKLADAYTQFRSQLACMPQRFRQVYDPTQLPSLSWMVSHKQVEELWNFVANAVCTTEADEIALRMERTYSQAIRFLTLSFGRPESLAFITQGDLGSTQSTDGDRAVGSYGNTPRELLCDQLEHDISRLNTFGSVLGANQPMPRDLVIALQAFWNASDTYYSVAWQRSTSMAKNVFHSMKARNVNKAILISGGFHSGDVRNWFMRSASMATISIVPSSGASDAASKAADYRYNKRLMEEE